MDPRQMVVLHEILGDELPVRVDVEAPSSDELELVQGIAPVALRQIAEPLPEGPRVAIEIHEDEAAPRLDVYGKQAVIRFRELPHLARVVESFLRVGDVEPLEVRSAEELSVERVAPRVVRAADHVLHA